MNHLSPFPCFKCDNLDLFKAFRVAVGDIFSNLVYFKQGQLAQEELCLAAGLDYPQLWTRDNAVNTWHAAGLLMPEVAKNSLRAVLVQDSTGNWVIGGQYWDAIIWAQGAWAYYLYQGDVDFLRESLGIIERSLHAFEQAEFDNELNLFRGPAFFQDGISGYPDELATGKGSEVLDWVKFHPSEACGTGFGIPWFALSTNSLYVRAYDVCHWMRTELGEALDQECLKRAERLRDVIRSHFWNTERGSFDYLLLSDGRRVTHQEGAGLAFAVLFNIATPEQTESIMKKIERQPGGLPAVWPQFERYASFGPSHFGRHAGCVWPQVQAMWARAALQAGHPELFAAELEVLAKHAVRDGHFTEIYHPETGQEYGGVQENYHTGELEEWASVPHTCWGATCFLGLIHMSLLGMRYSQNGIQFAPFLPNGVTTASLSHLTYRNAILHIKVSGSGSRLVDSKINGEPADPFLPCDCAGEIYIELDVRN